MYKKQGWRELRSQPAFNINHICSMNEADQKIFHCLNGSQAQCLHKKLLIQFWRHFFDDCSVKGANKIKREALKTNIYSGVKTQKERIFFLIEYSQMVIFKPKMCLKIIFYFVNT